MSLTANEKCYMICKVFGFEKSVFKITILKILNRTTATHETRCRDNVHVESETAIISINVTVNITRSSLKGF